MQPINSKISYVGGVFVPHDEAVLSIDDRAGLFSDAVYEVVYVTQGVAIDWDLHMQRLERSLAGLKIHYDVDSEVLKVVLHKLLEKNSLEEAYLYLQISRGAAKRDHAFPKESVPPAIVMTVTAMPPFASEKYEQGVAVITCPDLRWKRRDLKTVSLLPNVLAKQEAAEAGATEAVLIEEDGLITEGSSTNIFIVDQEGTLRTHPTSSRILSGITRKGVLQVAKELGIKIKEEAFTKAELYHAKEAFMTSTTKHVLPITKVDGESVGDSVGSITAQLIQAYHSYILKQL